jgi:hypothetical protein
MTKPTQKTFQGGQMDVQKLYHLYNKTYYLIASKSAIGTERPEADPATAAALALAAYHANGGHPPYKLSVFEEEIGARVHSR